MTSVMNILFLGTGTSTGVPQIGCSCAVCTSPDPRNKRLRSSVYVEAAGTRILLDSSPDLRQQALRENITDVDAVLYTHAHVDHVGGFDDLRAFCWRRSGGLPCTPHRRRWKPCGPCTAGRLNPKRPGAAMSGRNLTG